ncbi:MAG: metallophosphoesterase [Gemmataceae bacterium]
MSAIPKTAVPRIDLEPQRRVIQIDEWLLTPERAAIHLPTATAVIADLHLGYDLARCRSGDAVPTVSLEQQWAPLNVLFSHQAISNLAIAGDLVEKGQGDQMACLMRAWLHERDVDLIGIVPGNHDASIARDGTAPVFEAGFHVGNWLVVHGDKKLPAGNVILGHHHPCIRWGRQLTAPCFLYRDGCLVLPAFSQDAAGGNVLGNRKWRGFQCFVIAGTKMVDFGEL